MVRYFYIDNHDDLQWNMYVRGEEDPFLINPTDPGMDKKVCAALIVRALSSVKQCFEIMFGNAYINEHLHLAVMHTDNVPITYRENSLIFINSQCCWPLQVIYQFSHELCHLMIPRRVSLRFQWLEESICELASLFVLRHICNNQSLFPGEIPFSGIPTYIKTTEEGFYDLGNESVCEFIHRTLPVLESNPVNRSYNGAIAKALNPVFFQSPNLWKDIPLLCDISNAPDFRKGMNLWLKLSDGESRLSLSKVVGLLCN